MVTGVTFLVEDDLLGDFLIFSSVVVSIVAAADFWEIFPPCYLGPPLFFWGMVSILRVVYWD